jgi:hypothetical protein
MSLIPQYASIVNRVYSQFLGQLPNPPVFPSSQPDPEGVSRVALGRLAIFADDPCVAKRDPTTTLSFSLLTSEVIEKNIGMFAKLTQGEKEAFRALNEHGQPIRK